MTEYEGGWKSTLFDGRLKTQIDGYYNDYKNFQATIGYPNIPTFGFELNDPKKTTIYGFEASTQGQLRRPVGRRQPGAAAQLTRWFLRVQSAYPCSRAMRPRGRSKLGLLRRTWPGRNQPYAPNLTYSLGGGQYAFQLSHTATLSRPASISVTFPGQWATLFQDVALGDRLGPRNILGAQLAWSHGDLVATLYGTNLTDQHYIGAVQSLLRFRRDRRVSMASG